MLEEASGERPPVEGRGAVGVGYDSPSFVPYAWSARARSAAPGALIHMVNKRPPTSARCQVGGRFLELVAGLEPATYRLQGGCAANCATPAKSALNRTGKIPDRVNLPPRCAHLGLRPAFARPLGGPPEGARGWRRAGILAPSDFDWSRLMNRRSILRGLALGAAATPTAVLLGGEAQ